MNVYLFLVSQLALFLFGLVVGYITCARLTPRILASMTPEQTAKLAAKVQAERSKR